MLYNTLDSKAAHRIENHFYKLAVFFIIPNTTEGIIIMEHKKLKITIFGKDEDLEGRLTFL